MRKKTISKQMIIETVIKLVAEQGLEHFTTKKAALEMGVSEGTIFNNFPTKRSLLIGCLYFIDNEIDCVLENVSLQSTVLPNFIKELWYPYFDYFSTHGDCAKFYRQFLHSSYYDAEVVKGQMQSFKFFSHFLLNHSEIFQISPQIFWVFIIETTLNFAVRISDEHISPSDDSTDAIYQLLIHGIAGIYDKDHNS